MDLYFDYKHVNLNVTTTDGVAEANANLDSIQFFTAGAQIKF
jgi:hypothetical protein